MKNIPGQFNLNFEPEPEAKPKLEPEIEAENFRDVVGDELEKVKKDYEVGSGKINGDGTTPIRKIIFKDGKYYLRSLVNENEEDEDIEALYEQNKELGLGHNEYKDGDYK